MRNKRGITLIGLIITIIVMLILAGISISIVVEDNFFGKANNANQMNNEAINQANLDEDNALKQNYEDFTVDEVFETEGIEAYEYIENEDGTNNLKMIEYSLSKYLDEKGGSATVYFKANTNRETLYYEASNTNTEITINSVLYNEYLDLDSEYDNIKIATENDDPNFKLTNSLISVELTRDNLTDNLNGLIVKAKKSNQANAEVLYTLNFYSVNDTKQKPTLYIPTGEETYISKKDNTISLNGHKYNNDDKKYNISEIILESQISGTELSLKSAISTPMADDYKIVQVTDANTNEQKEISMLKYSSISNITKDTINFSTALESSIQNGKNDMKFYLVQEKKEDKTKTIYMDDYSINFYNPINSLELTSPLYMSYITPKSNAENIYYSAKDNNGNEADLIEYSAEILKNEDGDEIGNVIKNNHKFTVDSMTIFSDIETNDIIDEHKDTLKITLKAKDYGGKEITSLGEISLASNNFVVFATGDESSIDDDSYKKTLREAIIKAQSIKDSGKDATIRQLIGSYPIEEDLYDENGYFNICSPEIGNETYDLNNLTYDLNGNVLNFKDEAKLKIDDVKTFNLKSTQDANDKTPEHDNGSINFNHDTTFQSESIIKHISREDFLSREKYKKFESLKTFIESLGEKYNLITIIKYTGLYTTRLMNAYREYLDSFNMIGFNVNYKHSMSGVVNYGTFNFESGKIVLQTDEKVMAIGAFGGGTVLSIADGFLKILNALGVETASITQFTASYAKIENTGVGVENYGTTRLGTDTRTGVTDDTQPFPEISVSVESAENGIGISVGSITNPNRAVSRAYGVWNAGIDTNGDGKINTLDKNGNTIMNSGFIEMSILNKTNNWVSLGVGRAYGIFNDWGNTTINGFTRKNVQLDLAIWGLDNLNNAIGDYQIDEDAGKIKANLTKLLQDVNAKVKEKWTDFETIKMDGFFTASTQQILYKATGFATTCYTNSYAVANANGRKTYIIEGEGDDGITFGGNLKLANKELEIDTKNLWGKLELPLPLYYVVYYEDENGNERESDYNLNVFQSIVNPINYYLDFNTIAGSGISLASNVLNNIFSASWIGQDFQDENLISNILGLSIRGIFQGLTK